MGLDSARKKIDRIDAEIVRLLDERANVGREIGEIKRRQNLPLHNPEREREVLQKLRAQSDGSLPAHALDNVYRAIMAETLALQEANAGENKASCAGHDATAKIDAAATIVENAEAAPGFYRMRVFAPELAGVFSPGQFFQIRIGEDGGRFFLRRPFAPSEYAEDGLSFYYAVVGGGTRALAALPSGTRLRILAPLGHGYSLPPPGAKALLIGGGCGAPSLAPLARRLRETGVRATVILGARTSSTLLACETFDREADRLIVATDDGSRGCRGTIADAYRLERENVGAFERLYACGPLPMLRVAAALAAEGGVDCEVSLEERMACGFGACMGCVVPVLNEAGADKPSVFRRVCHDGPVFNSLALAWDEMK